MSLACETCPVRDSAACAVLTSDERADLARAGRHRKLARGEVLFHAGSADPACATLVRGALKIATTDIDGNERILALVHPAGFVGELFQPFARHDVVALGEAEVCLFGAGDFEAALAQHPSLAQALLRRSQADLHQSRALLALSASNSARVRVGGAILALAEAASDSPCHPARSFDLPLTRGELANLLGLTIESVSRALTRLERDGAIRREGRRGIELLDPARLSLS